MKKTVAYFILFSVLPIVLATLISCSSLTQSTQTSDCDINDRDTERILGTKARFLDKTDPLLGLSPEEQLNQNVKACGYQSDEGSFIYVQRNEYTTEEEAIRFYDLSKDLLISTESKNAGDYWEDEVHAIADKGYMIHAYHEDGLHVDVVGRVGKTAFTIRSRGSKSNKAFSHVSIKGLAVSISRKFLSNN